MPRFDQVAETPRARYSTIDTIVAGRPWVKSNWMPTAHARLDASATGMAAALLCGPLGAAAVTTEPFSPKLLSCNVIAYPTVATGRSVTGGRMSLGVAAQPARGAASGSSGVAGAESWRWVARCCLVTRQPNRSLHALEVAIAARPPTSYAPRIRRSSTHPFHETPRHGVRRYRTLPELAAVAAAIPARLPDRQY